MNTAEINPIPPPLAFSWAKDNGIIIIPTESGCKLLCRSSVMIDAYLEGRRLAIEPTEFSLISDKEFETCLLRVYQQDSMQARQIMEEMGNELNFYTLAEKLPKNDDLLDTSDEAPIIKLINAMLTEAIQAKASDIHIEPFENNLIIRFRIDGVLKKIIEPVSQLASLLVSRIKVMAQLDIAEKRLPQDGRIALHIAGRTLDVRISTLPSNHGERVVMRLLDKNNIKLDLKYLGLTAKNYDLMIKLIQRPHGVILITGPTGSGKSTTLYAALKEIDSTTHNIMTIEDPIEFDLNGISQTQVNPKVDMTFARGLRAILRQDPDVVLIGEIRDVETAKIAVQASLTGHLVLSTLHTNSTVGAITRLHDMGIEPFMLSSSLLAIMSQRLVRTLCLFCRKQYILIPENIKSLGVNYHGISFSGYQAVGCQKCNFSGYQGRIGIHELSIIDDEVREAIYHGRGEIELKKLVKNKTLSIQYDALEKIIAGITSLEEVLRIIKEDINEYL